MENVNLDHYYSLAFMLLKPAVVDGIMTLKDVQVVIPETYVAKGLCKCDLY
jgi:hypothetical protein